MDTNASFSPSILKDLRERVQINFSDEFLRKQNLKYIEKIAYSLNIGKKFKVSQMELLYLLCTKSPIELGKIYQISDKFKECAQAIGDNEDDKNLLCRVFCNYIKEQMKADSNQQLIDRIAQTFPAVLNYARDDDTDVSVFYDIHREENVKFSKREIIDKFYSVNYGVLVANLGQIKTPIFFKRNLKTPSCEARRLDIMFQALERLSPAKFMLFALHFDKYIEKLPKIDDDLAIGSINNVVPLIKNGQNRILNSVGNIWGTDITDHGSSGFIFRCLTSRVTPYNITRLCRLAEQIPSSDDNRFEQIRLDAISINDTFPQLRSYIHNQQPEQHKLIKRMVLYYDAARGFDPKLDVEMRREKLEQTIKYIDSNSPEYKLKDDDLFNIAKYEKSTRDIISGQLASNIDILRRLKNNTTPRTLEIPQINDVYTKNILDAIMDVKYPFAKHEIYGFYLQKLNDHLERKMKVGAIGIQPKTINSILWSERRGYLVLQNMDAGYQLYAYRMPWFKEILRFYELTNSAEDMPNADLEKFLFSIKDMEMEKAYPQISERIGAAITKLTKRQKNDAGEYSDYVGSLSISEAEKEKQQKKIKDTLEIKISRNLSGYGLANALFNCLSEKRTPYKALERYMEERKQSR